MESNFSIDDNVIIIGLPGEVFTVIAIHDTLATCLDSNDGTYEFPLKMLEKSN